MKRNEAAKRVWAAWAAAVVAWAPPAPGQDLPPEPPRDPVPAEDPELDDPQLDEDAKALQKQRPGQEPRVSPKAERDEEPSQPGLPGPLEALPGLEGSDYLLRTPVIRSEGVFLTMQRGTLVRGRGGEWWFVFHRDVEGRVERPMILLPCQTLERMVAGVEGREGPVYRVTGQVFVYYRRNYFLPTTALLSGGTEGSAPVQIEGPPGPGKASPEGRSVSIEDLIDELTPKGEQARALGAQVGGGGRPEQGDAARAADSSAEGRILSRRRGRMVRSGAAWAFAFDNDPDGSGAAERPLVLVPCLNLETMETIAAKQGDGVIFELSGRVLSFRGRNYIIPTMFQVVRDREVRPLQ